MLKYGEVSVRGLSCRAHGAVPYDTLYTNIRRRASAAALALFPYFQVTCPKRKKSASFPLRKWSCSSWRRRRRCRKRGKKNRQAAAHAAACPYKGQVTECTYERSTAGASFFTLPAGQCCPARWRSRLPPLCTAPVLPAAWSPCPGASPSARRPSPPDGSVPGSARYP